MNKIILCLGISGSGKTTFAKQWTEEDPIHRIRLNYDDLRCMLGKYWVPEREPLMLDIFKKALDKAMTMQYDIVIDNMSNLNPKHIAEYNDIVDCYNSSSDTDNTYKLEFKLFDTPVDECIRRDALRPLPIEEKVIRQQWRKYRNYIIQQSIKDMLDNQIKNIPNLPHCIIADMDATLCFNTTGRPFYGEGVEKQMINDIPNTNIINLVRAYCEIYDCELIIITGRDESCREVTLEWLDKHYLYPNQLFMRQIGDYSKGEECKKKIFEDNIRNKYNVDLVFEDSSKVVKMYRDLGLTVLQPNEGKF